MAIIEVLGYGCTSFAGQGVEALWQALQSADSRLTREACDAREKDWQRLGSAQAWIVQNLLNSWYEIRRGLPAHESICDLNKNLGVIFASTKGCCEDFVWEGDPSNDRLGVDFLQAVLTSFVEQSELTPQMQVCVSNACSSVHGALFLANSWLKEGRLASVLILAADLIGPFISRGFGTLRALAQESVRPFSHDRDGLLLASGAAAILLRAGSNGNEENKLVLAAVEIEAEGSSATRPSTSGQSLRNCFERAFLAGQLPCERLDLVIAHGTGTLTNDLIEDRVFYDVTGGNVPITAVKWAIGHTMGASGAMDLIAGCEVLKRQKVFCIATTQTIDGTLRGTYLTKKQGVHPREISSVAISSLGFGGMNGALILKKGRVERLAARSPLSKNRSVFVKRARLKGVHSLVCLPPQEIPGLSEKVERWYQLDQASLALVVTHYHWRESLLKPNYIFLASEQASNVTDFEFARGGAASPSKFVHTLPSVRSAALLQVMDWRGPILCLQAGRGSLVRGIKIAIQLLKPGDIAWMIRVHQQAEARCEPGQHLCEVSMIELQSHGQAISQAEFRDCEVVENDVDIVNWFPKNILSHSFAVVEQDDSKWQLRWKRESRF